MDIDRLERFWIWISALVLAGLFLAIVYSSYGWGIHVATDSGQIDPQRVAETPPFDAPGLHRTGEHRYDLVMRVSAWRFEPAEVRIPAGSTVDFQLTSQDVLHGFHLVNTTVNLMIAPGQIARATHKFDKPGTYTWVCHEYCGAGHHVMSGKLIVEPVGAEQAYGD